MNPRYAKALRKIADDNSPVWFEDVPNVPLILTTADRHAIAEEAARWLALTVGIYRARNRRKA